MTNVIAEYTERGYACRIRRIPSMGYLCGYVQLPVDHPWLKLDLQLGEGPTCHGGITFGPDYPDYERWIGFDCAHAEDFCPGPFGSRGVLRDEPFVRSELSGIITQAEGALCKTS